MNIAPLCGWAGPKAANEAFDELQDNFVTFNVVGQVESSAGKRCVLWDYARKVNGGKDLLNTPQLVGDCVSWGMKHALDHLACMEIIRLGDNEEFHASFAPYFYGISRFQIGGGRLGHDDGSDRSRNGGSLGSWAAEGVRRYGVLRANTPGVPKYSKQVALDWGNKGPPQEFIDVAKQHLLKSAARINSWEKGGRDALFNGYPLTIASMRGYQMQLKDDGGKSWYTGREQWAHQMCIIGYDETGSRPGAFRLNSWGPDAHGPQLDGPAGGGWIDVEDLDKELRSGDTEAYALSQFDGFPAQKLSYLLG